MNSRPGRKLFPCILIGFILYTAAVRAEGKDADPKAVEIMENSLGKVLKSGDAAITFEGVGMNMSDPLKIFSLPAYQMIRGGYLYLKDQKYEMAIGSMKTLCDGRLLVVVDEVSKVLYVDSARNVLKNANEKMPDVAEVFEKTFGKVSLSYEGREIINKRDCHKIKAFFTKEKREVIYWVDVKTNSLYLMAEKYNDVYTTYWFREIKKVPAKYAFTVYLPKKLDEKNKYHGYEVIDNRFNNRLLKGSK